MLLLCLEIGAILWVPHNPFFGFPTVPPGAQVRVQLLGKKGATGIHSSNSLGLRGDEPPPPGSGLLRVVAMGGSTTHDFFLEDKQTWVYQLQENLIRSGKKVWIGNAGVLGHTVRGHRVVYQNIVSGLRPKVVLVKAGLNDARLTVLDKENHAHQFVTFGRSRFFQFFYTSLQRWQGKGPIPTGKPWQGYFPPADGLKGPQGRQMEGAVRAGLAKYRKELGWLVQAIKKDGALPVLITQTHVGLNRPDDFSGPYGSALAPMKKEFKNLRVSQFLKILARFNRETLDLCRQKRLKCLDLGGQFPDREAFFYDPEHFNESGAKRAADLLAKDLLAKEIIFGP